MERTHEAFDIKLDELTKQFAQLQNNILICKNGEHDDIRQEIIKTKEEYEEKKLLLENRVDHSRSQLAAALAKAQVDYSKKTEDILGKDILEQEESASLYTEYAIDFTIQSLQHTQLALLYVMDQKLSEEKPT